MIEETVDVSPVAIAPLEENDATAMLAVPRMRSDLDYLESESLFTARTVRSPSDGSQVAETCQR